MQYIAIDISKLATQEWQRKWIQYFPIPPAVKPITLNTVSLQSSRHVTAHAAGWLQAAGCSLSLLLMSSNARTLTLTVSTVTAAATASHLLLFSHYRFCTASLLIKHSPLSGLTEQKHVFRCAYSCLSREITNLRYSTTSQEEILYCLTAVVTLLFKI